MTPSTPAPATAAPFVVAVSKEHRLNLSVKAAALKTVLAKATLDAQPRLSSTERRNLEHAVENVLLAVRTATQMPVLNHIAGTIESLLAPIFQDAQFRRRIARQSDLYCNALATFAGDKRSKTAPKDSLLREAAAWLKYAEGLLEGKSIQELALPGALA